MAASSQSAVPAFSHYVTLLPPYGCSSGVPYRCIAIPYFPKWWACDVCDYLLERHLCIMLAGSDASSSIICHSISGACWKIQQLALWLPAPGSPEGLPRGSCCFMPQSLIQSPNAVPSLTQAWSPCSEGNALFLWKTNLNVIWWHTMNIHAYGLSHVIPCWAMRRKCTTIKFWLMHNFCGKCDVSIWYVFTIFIFPLYFVNIHHTENIFK
jgi:hypothetical protein